MSDALSPPNNTPAAPVPPTTPPVAAPGTGARIIAVTSGKGGVGKTFVSANLPQP